MNVLYRKMKKMYQLRNGIEIPGENLDRTESSTCIKLFSMSLSDSCNRSYQSNQNSAMMTKKGMLIVQCFNPNKNISDVIFCLVNLI